MGFSSCCIVDAFVVVLLSSWPMVICGMQSKIENFAMQISISAPYVYPLLGSLALRLSLPQESYTMPHIRFRCPTPETSS